MAFLVLSSLGVTGETVIENYAGGSDGGCPYIGNAGIYNPALEQGFGSVFYVAMDQKTGDAYYSIPYCGSVMFHNRSTNLITLFAGRPYAGSDMYYNGPASSALLYGPTVLQVDPDSKYLYIGDWWPVIRRVDLSTQMITTIGGTGGFSVDYYFGDHGDGGPATSATLVFSDFYFNTSRYLFFADTVSRIRRIDMETNIVTHYAGSAWSQGFAGGSLTSALFNQPRSIRVDKTGSTVYVFNRAVCGFHRIDMMSGMVSTWWGGSRCISAGDDGPIALATSFDNVQICGTDSRGKLLLS